MKTADGHEPAPGMPEDETARQALPVGKKEALDFPIVGIGASAGGLAAFERFFTSLPENVGMAFVVIQHLSSPHKSILPEILQRFTTMKVLQVTDGIEVEPNCVYVIPPSNNLALMNGHLLLLKPANERAHRFPIDFFFRSLAEARKNQAIGVVLSGSASDGSLGIKMIKAEGGLTVAQAPETAEFTDMPRNAIATHDIDYVLPPEKIGELIITYVNHHIEPEYWSDEDQTMHAVGSLQRLYLLLRAKTGHDFSLYKQNTLLRRIDRRIKISLVSNLEEYIRHLQDHPEEVDALFHEMLINVTHFFRDPDAYLTLTEKVIRPLVSARAASQVGLRVWVAGCSSGEEAYSVAIAIQEQIEAQKCDCKVQIYATDLDIEAIVTARRGVYADGSLENVSAERLKRFFTKEEDGFHIKKSIRDMVVFSTQNLIFDPPFSRIDLLCCRNVLIYLQPELQKQMFPMFHYALNPNGILFLGNSESVGSFSDLFSVVDRKHKIYQRKNMVVQHRIQTNLEPAYETSFHIATEVAARRAAPGELREWTERELLKYHTPACVVVDEKNTILYIHGRTGKYLEPPPGETSANLLRMAREGLKVELAAAIHECTTTRKVVTRQGLRVKTNGDYQLTNLTVRPVDLDNGRVIMTMIVFEEMSAPSVDGQQKSVESLSRNQHISQLEKALKEKDEFLTSIINELEDTNQELKSINEELLSSNEEMQSSNEELETSREELQSINEELSTVNAELQNKNIELTQLNNDVYNLLASTEIGTIFLDLELRLRRFTPAIQRVYNFLPVDIGRALSDFRSNLQYELLLDDIRQVLKSLMPRAVEAQVKDGTWYLINIQPYRTLENVIDGVVITFVDISRQKQRDEQRRLETLVRDSNDAVTVQGFDGKIQAWNQTAVQMYGWSEVEALAMNIVDMIPEYLREGTLDLYRRMVKGENVRSYETKRVARNGRVLDVWVTLSVLYDYTNQPIGISTTERDITDRKQSDQKILLENRSLKILNEWYKNFEPGTMTGVRYHELCLMLVGSGGYRLAWIGLPGSNSKTIEAAYWAGFEFEESTDGPPESLLGLVRRSQKLVETALKIRRPITIRNIMADPVHRSWRTEALKLAFHAFAIFPLISGKETLGVLVLYANEGEAFIEQELENGRILAEEITRKLG